jgi:hypothetical protein
MSTAYSRRRFLKLFAESFGYLGISALGLELLAKSLLQKAMAATISDLSPSGYYLHWSFPGAPPRWFFDLLLTPGGLTSTNFIPGGFGNSFKGSGSSLAVEYKVNKHVIGGKTLYLPPVWSMSPSSTDFTSILPNTLFVRGMDMEIDNHNLSNQRQVCPIIGGVSLSGAVADRSTCPVPAINDLGTAASVAFKSKKGLAKNDISYSVSSTVNPVSTLLKPFSPFFSGRPQHTADQVALQEQAFREFERQAQKAGINGGALGIMYDNAMDLISQNIGSLGDQWASVFAKYENLIQAALIPKKGSLPGVFDKAIPGSATDPRFRFERLTGDFLTLPDIRDMITSSVVIPRLAENFSIAELTLHSLTSTLTLSAGSIDKINFNGALKRSTHDQHYVGTAVGVIQNTLFFRAFLAGLTEQVRVLKQKGLFDRTVIHISAEFNRIPKTDGSGADHGVVGSNATLISGMIGEAGVVGNIKKDYSANYKGTWGVADHYVLGGLDRPIQVNDVALTVSSMLGIDSIVTNGRSLLSPNTAGKWYLRKAEAKNV